MKSVCLAYVEQGTSVFFVVLIAVIRNLIIGFF